MRSAVKDVAEGVATLEFREYTQWWTSFSLTEPGKGTQRNDHTYQSGKEVLRLLI